jgi:hypothetical protein
VSEHTNTQLVEALKSSTEALTAWLHQYAPDCCESESVERYRNLIDSNGGTLAYIARHLRANRAALKEAREGMTA